MSTATVTSKGQITIPVEVRKALGLSTGDQIAFVQVAPDRFEFVVAANSVTQLKGMFGKAGRKVSVQQMNRVIARRASGRSDSST